MSRWKGGGILFGFGSVGIIVVFMMIKSNFLWMIQQEFEKNIVGGFILIGCAIFLLGLFVIVPFYTFFTSHKIPIVHIYDDGIRVRTEPGRKSFPITLGDMKQEPNGRFVSYYEIHSIKQHRGLMSVYLKPERIGVPRPLFASWWMLLTNDRNEIFDIIQGKIL